MYKCCLSVLNFMMYWGLASITVSPTMSFSKNYCAEYISDWAMA